jgi:hypothetical protein
MVKKQIFSNMLVEITAIEESLIPSSLSSLGSDLQGGKSKHRSDRSQRFFVGQCLRAE